MRGFWSILQLARRGLVIKWTKKINLAYKIIKIIKIMHPPTRQHYPAQRPPRWRKQSSNTWHTRRPGRIFRNFTIHQKIKFPCRAFKLTSKWECILSKIKKNKPRGARAYAAGVIIGLNGFSATASAGFEIRAEVPYLTSTRECRITYPVDGIC